MSFATERMNHMAVEAIIDGRDATNLMVKGYLEAAFWTEEENSELEGKTYFDIEPDELRKVIAEVITFKEDNQSLIERGIEENPDLSWEDAGHDLWLTQNGHGSGFWDGDWATVGAELTRKAGFMGESVLYAGDDGKIYFS